MYSLLHIEDMQDNYNWALTMMSRSNKGGTMRVMTATRIDCSLQGAGAVHIPRIHSCKSIIENSSRRSSNCIYQFRSQHYT